MSLIAFLGPAAYAQSSSGTVGPNPALPTVVVEGQRIQPESNSGTNDYKITNQDIENMPAGDNTVLTDVLAQMPGVGIDQNQQVHIRNTEGSGFQYQINGALVPFDIITNPPFISMINPLFIQRMDLEDGILPAEYSYSMGGVVSIQTKDGCHAPGGDAELFAGQRSSVQPSLQYAGCDGNFSYYGSLIYSQNNMAFSSATPGPTPIHNFTNQGELFGVLAYAFDTDTRLSLIISSADSDNQLPNVAGLPPAYTLAGVTPEPSSQINSYLNFRDYLAILTLNGRPSDFLSYDVSYTVHSIAQLYEPDDAGELIYQGVASQAMHKDFDNTLQGDLKFTIGAHTLGAGIYVGAYDVTADSNSLVFPSDAYGNQTSSVPVGVVNDIREMNVLTGVYVEDVWEISKQWRVNLGLRRDELTGISPGRGLDPTLALTFTPQRATTIHGGIARYFQVPSFEGIAPRAPTAFEGTTGAGPPGATSPLTESDWEVDIGVVQQVAPGFTISEDNFFESTRHYLDAGQFGAVPIFAPFNYDHGHIWGSEIAVEYKTKNLSTYANLTAGRNYEKGVVTGQFNFDAPGELQYIDAHYIDLDHQPLLTINSGAAYSWQRYKFSIDGQFNTGLRTGFANLQSLPNVLQINGGVARSWTIAGHRIDNQLTLVNMLDRVNLIRPSGGLGVFQAAYGPRFTVFYAIKAHFQ
jgi:hypothetical protein